MEQREMEIKNSVSSKKNSQKILSKQLLKVEI